MNSKTRVLLLGENRLEDRVYPISELNFDYFPSRHQDMSDQKKLFLGFCVYFPDNSVEEHDFAFHVYEEDSENIEDFVMNSDYSAMKVLKPISANKKVKPTPGVRYVSFADRTVYALFDTYERNLFGDQEKIGHAQMMLCKIRKGPFLSIFDRYETATE
jgi:hypothetical protein